MTMYNSDVQLFFSRFLDKIGNGSGEKNAAANYSNAGSGLIEFKLAPASSQRFLIYALHVHYDDSGTFDSNRFGNNIDITGGVSLQVKNTNGDVLIDITDGVKCKNNGDWDRYAHEIAHINMGSGPEMLTAKFEFETHGAPLRLDGDSGEYLAAILNDNFSGLEEFRFVAQGVIQNITT